MMIIKGNREQIIDLVTRLYNFSLRHSNQNDELIIELNHHKITFSNNNFNYLTLIPKVANTFGNNVLSHKHYYHPLFTDEKTQAQRG